MRGSAERFWILLIASVSLSASAEQFRLPKHPPPALFGKVLIQRLTAVGAVKPVSFSHATHRVRYTCRVCHLELDFAFKRNGTEITEEANRKGFYCGACHNGRIAFGHTEENCARCHTGTLEDGVDDLAKVRDLPTVKFGNGVDWSAAVKRGDIKPVSSLSGDYHPLQLNTTLSLESDWNFVPPATFPHAEHVLWLDCANCHPAIFNVKKKGTQHFSMLNSLAGEFCGVCHVRVAFPLDDCLRCHPTMTDRPFQ